MARGGALEAGDLAAHAHPLEGPLERALHPQGDLRDSELRHVAGSSSGMGGAAGGAIGIKIAHGCCRLCYKTAAGQAKAERGGARSLWGGVEGGGGLRGLVVGGGGRGDVLCWTHGGRVVERGVGGRGGRT